MIRATMGCMLRMQREGAQWIAEQKVNGTQSDLLNEKPNGTQWGLLNGKAKFGAVR